MPRYRLARTNQCPFGDLGTELSFWGPSPKFGDNECVYVKVKNAKFEPVI